MLRDGWREVRIADLGRVVTGTTPRAADGGSWGDAVDFITPGDQRPGARDVRPARRLSAAGAQRLASRLVPAGSTLVTCIGATIGKTSLTARPAVTNQQVNAVVPDEATVSREFLYYLLTAHAPRIAQVASGSATQIVTKRQFERLRVLLPPRAEQVRIAGFLGPLDDKIAANQRAARTALELAEAMYDRLVSDVPSVPCRLGDLAELRYGKALPAASRRPGRVPVYGSGGVVGAHDLALVSGPGIVVGRKGTAGAVHWSQRDFFPIDTVFYVARAADDVPLEFLFFALRRLGLAGLRSDSAVPGLSRASVLTSRLPVPGPGSLREFHREVRPLFALRESLATQSVALAALRDEVLSPVPLGAPRAAAVLSVRFSP
jgi:type I restriction enzyme S subunit